MMRVSLRLFSVAALVLLGTTSALAQPFPPFPFGPFGPPRVPRPPFMIPRVIVVPPPAAPVIVQPGVEVEGPILGGPVVEGPVVEGHVAGGTVTVEITPPRVAEAILRLRERIRAELAARRAVHLTLGDALLLGLDIDVQIGSFFRLESTHPNLQVAVVIDGTDSMARDLDSLKNTLAAIVHRIKSVKPDGQVEFSFVVYRDTGVVSKSGGRIAEVTSPVNEFTSNTDYILSQIRKQRVATGEPYFEELIDEGLYQTMARMNWSNDPATSRWILLCGDAPPYPDAHPMRRHAAESLVQLAHERGITVHSILCRSGFLPPYPQSGGFNVAETSDRLRPRLQSFMAEISTGTGGQFLDLSDPAAIEVLAAVSDVGPVNADGSAQPPSRGPRIEVPVEELPPPEPVPTDEPSQEPAPPAEPAPPSVKADGAGAKVAAPAEKGGDSPKSPTPTEAGAPPKKYRSALVPSK